MKRSTLDDDGDARRTSIRRRESARWLGLLALALTCGRADSAHAADEDTTEPRARTTDAASSTETEETATGDEPDTASLAGPYVALMPGLLHLPLPRVDPPVGYQWGLRGGTTLELGRIARLGVGGVFQHALLQVPRGAEPRVSSHQLRIAAEARPGVGLLDDRLFVYGDLGAGYVAWPTRIDFAGMRTRSTAHGVVLSVGAGASYTVWRNLFVGGRVGASLQWFRGPDGFDGAHDLGVEGMVGWRFGPGGRRRPPPPPAAEAPPSDPSFPEEPEVIHPYEEIQDGPVPYKVGADSVRICGLNIDKLGFETKTLADLEAKPPPGSRFAVLPAIIAEHCDIVAVTEVMASRLLEVEPKDDKKDDKNKVKVSVEHPGFTRLKKAMEGIGWKSMVSTKRLPGRPPKPGTLRKKATTDEKTAHRLHQEAYDGYPRKRVQDELYAIFYNPKVVKKCKGWTTLRTYPDPKTALSWSGDIRRDPAVGCFETPVTSTSMPIKIDFLLGVYHAPFKVNESVREAEVRAMAKVFGWMRQQRPTEHDLFIVGDFNLGHDRVEAELVEIRKGKKLYASPVLPVSGKTADRNRSGGGSTLVSPGNTITKNLYDQFIIYDPVASKEVKSVRIIDTRKNMPGKASAHKKERAYYKEVSNHLLIQAVAEAETDDD